MIVTEWIDGTGFDDVCRLPDAVRDRYAEIIYRFFYGTARDMGLALGDPHPGNYRLCADGSVAFFDFGMLRPLPGGYLAREAAVSRAVSAGDEQAVIGGMHALGYLPGNPGNWDAGLLLEYMRALSWWLTVDGPLRLAPGDVWRAAELLRAADGRTRFAPLRNMTFPAEALLLRRMDGLLFQMAATLRASAHWGGLLRELTEGGETISELGAQHAAWLANRHPRAPGRGPGTPMALARETDDRLSGAVPPDAAALVA